jgi:hypothetical protein
MVDRMDTSENQSISLYYTDMDDNEDDDCCNGVDEDDAQASKIQADA